MIEAHTAPYRRNSGHDFRDGTSLRWFLYIPMTASAVMLVVVLCVSAWHGASFQNLRALKTGYIAQHEVHPTGIQSQCLGPNCDSGWSQHLAVFTYEDLGLWQTSFFGVAGGSKGAEDATLLQHWWRCQPVADGRIDLRGFGSAYSAVDASGLMQLVPWSVNSYWAGLNITDMTVNHTWQLQQSAIAQHGINVWHAEASNLSATNSYNIRPSSILSKHSYEWDVSRCKQTPELFRPGSIWSVVTQAAEYRTDMYAQLLMQHTSYHKAVGFAGTIMILGRKLVAKLTEHPEVQKGLDEKSVVIIVWDADIVPSMPYYYQYLMYNMAVLATWGVPDIKLAMIDLDEFIILPKHLTFTEAFKPGGCLHGYHHIRMSRVNAYFGITPAEASACHHAFQAAEANASTTVNATNCGSHCTASQVSLLERCKDLVDNFLPDIHGLNGIGWPSYFRQQPAPQQQWKQEVRRQLRSQQHPDKPRSPVGFTSRCYSKNLHLCNV